MKTFFTYFLILFSIATFSQTNLVQNGSFEQIDSCYGNFAPLGLDVFQWSGCVGWSNPTYASSDLWCNNGVVGTLQPPNLPAGYQLPKTGDNMAGIFVLDAAFQTYREYLQAELSEILINNIIYELIIYVNVPFNFNVTSSFGAYFSTNFISVPSSYDNLPFLPQVKNNESIFITDTLDWQKISLLYKAKGGEKYLVLGNFLDSLSMINVTSASQDDDSLFGNIYFFIDDVEVTETPYSYVIPNVFTPNGDGFNDVFSPNVVNIDKWKCFIYNRWGQNMYELNNDVTSWDGKTTNGKNVPDGTYYYIFTANIENKNMSEKGFITLLR